MAKTDKAAGRRRTATKPREEAVLDVTVVLLDGGYASTAIGPIEVFHSAGRLWNWLRGESLNPRFRVRTASIDGRSVTSICSLGLVPEFALEDIAHTDIVVLPASGWDLMESIAARTILLSWLRQWHAQGAYIAGICSGVGYLAEAGLLDHRKATTHWAVAEIFRHRYPQVEWHPEHFVTEDGRVCCSGGLYASIDLSLYLVEKFCGHEIALQTAKSMLVSMPRSRQSGYAVVPLAKPHGDDRIRKAEEHLHQHFNQTVSIEVLAERIGMSPRNFIRRFQTATGHMPGEYLQLLRLAVAKELLERDGLPIQTLCARIGYQDVAFFRSLFKRHTGMTPAEYRSRFSAQSLDRGELFTLGRGS